MTNDQIKAGDSVEHKSLGRGKVLYVDGVNFRAYFKGRAGVSPEARTAEFPLSSGFVKVVEYHPDAELDNLPPWRDGRFVRYSTKLNLGDAKAAFLRQFRHGFNDPEYVRKERDYKVAAHDRYEAGFAPNVDQWLNEGNWKALSKGLDQAYGDPKAAREGVTERLNLLYQRVEEPAFFDALEAGGELTGKFVAAALRFVDESSESAFQSFTSALLALPTRSGRASLDHWTTLTWLPFVAAPDKHMFLKPSITQAFASLLPFEIAYRADLNYHTYVRSTAMAMHLRERLEESELNLSHRPIDLIDVQSFMWVVVRYTDPPAVSHA